MIGSLACPAVVPGDDPVREDGIYLMPLERYHGDCCDAPSISSSSARTIFSQSPAHYWLQSPFNPQRKPDDVSEAMLLGGAAHHLLLGEQGFSARYVVRPEILGGKPWNGNRTDCREWLDAAAGAGLQVLKPDQAARVTGMAEALARHPLVRAGILSGHVERSYLWFDGTNRIWCKSRPDATPTDGGDFGDLKVTESVYPDAIARKIEEYRYDMQAAMVRRACRALLGLEMASYSLVFVESKPPHAVVVAELDPTDIELADADLEVALRVFRHCLDTGEWPGPGGTQSDSFKVRRPVWGVQKAEARRLFLEREVAA